MKRAINITTLFLLGLSLTGCGVYTFNPAGKSTVRTISVEPFQNQTDELELGDRITEVIVDAFIDDGNLKVVAPGAADAVLMGNLTGYRRVPNEFTESDQVISYKLLIDFEISLVDAKNGSELWKERIRQQGVYEADTETEEEGQQRAVERLVEEIINRTTKSW